MHCWSGVWILAWRLIYLAFVLKYDVRMYIKDCHGIKHMFSMLSLFLFLYMKSLAVFILGNFLHELCFFFSLWLWKQDKIRLLQQLDRNIYKPSVDKFSFSTVKHCAWRTWWEILSLMFPYMHRHWNCSCSNSFYLIAF